MGRLYRKEEVIVELLQRKQKKDTPVVPQVAHITSMKDVLEVILAVNPASAHIVTLGEEAGCSSVKNILSLWVCTITGHSTTGTHAFNVCAPCGHVVSHEAVKALGKGTHEPEGEDTQCPACGAAAQFFEIAPTEEVARAQLPKFKECMRSFNKKRKSESEAKKETQGNSEK